MFLVKRTIASLVDLILFVVVILIVFKVLNYSNIFLENKYFLLVIFFMVFFIPIAYLKATVGNKILKITCNSSFRLIFKYFIIYSLISGVFIAYLSLFSSISNISSKSTVSLEILSVYSLGAIIIINTLIYFISYGRFDLFDFVLSLYYSNKSYKRSSEIKLIIWLTFVYLTTVFYLGGKLNYINDFISNLVSANSVFVSTKYYPKEVLDEFSLFQIEKKEKNNEIISFSNNASFFENKILGQKTIYALTNKPTFEDENKRFILCKLLIQYSNINDVFDDEYDFVDQTKIVLVYNESQTYFTSTTRLYTYYYDNKDPKHLIYGGIELDSLISYHKKNLAHYLNSSRKALAISLNQNEDSLTSRLKNGDSIQITQEEYRKYQKILFELCNVNTTLVNTIIPFGLVKPTEYLSINFPHKNSQMINFIDYQLWDDKLNEAIYFRDLRYDNNY